MPSAVGTTGFHGFLIRPPANATSVPRPNAPSPMPSDSPTSDTRGHLIVQGYLGARPRQEILAWLGSIHPIWQFRFATDRPPPRGEAQRRLLRPVY